MSHYKLNVPRKWFSRSQGHEISMLCIWKHICTLESMQKETKKNPCSVWILFGILHGAKLISNNRCNPLEICDNNYHISVALLLFTVVSGIKSTRVQGDSLIHDRYYINNNSAMIICKPMQESGAYLAGSTTGDPVSNYFFSAPLSFLPWSPCLRLNGTDSSCLVVLSFCLSSFFLVTAFFRFSFPFSFFHIFLYLYFPFPFLLFDIPLVTPERRARKVPKIRPWEWHIASILFLITIYDLFWY